MAMNKIERIDKEIAKTREKITEDVYKRQSLSPLSRRSFFRRARLCTTA